MSQPTKTATHRAKHPENERIRKEKQRERDAVMLFHIKRSIISGIPVPGCVDTYSSAYRRVWAAYRETLEEQTVTEYNDLREPPCG